MRNVGAWGNVGGSLAAGILLAVAAAAGLPAEAVAQAKKDSRVQRLEIYNGATRTVHYFADGLSRSERMTLRDLERAENELALADQLLALRAQYVRDERVLQQQRRAVQEQLLIASSGYAPGVYPDQVRAVDANTALALASNNYYSGLYGGTTYVGGFYYPEAYTGSPAYVSSPYTNGVAGTVATRMTAAVLDEGPFKTQLVHTLATQATPQFAAQARQSRDTVLARAGGSERLREMLNLPKAGGPRAAESAKPAPARVPVTVTLKGGKQIKGILVKEDSERVVLDIGKEELEIRRAETISIARPKK